MLALDPGAEDVADAVAHGSHFETQEGGDPKTGVGLEAMGYGPDPLVDPGKHQTRQLQIRVAELLAYGPAEANRNGKGCDEGEEVADAQGRADDRAVGEARSVAHALAVGEPNRSQRSPTFVLLGMDVQVRAEHQAAE